MTDTTLIKDKLDIVDFISEYVELKPAGVNHKGLCPFHHEKTPSFMVSRERGSWHCFGCGKGGDAFSFLQEIEGLEFVEALKLLAARTGVTLTQSERQSLAQSERARLKEVNREAARFFYNFLAKMEAAGPAREYLKERGLKPDTVDEWQIGFIPEQWDLLTKYLLKKGVGIDDLVASGLTIKRDDADRATGRGFYDRFRGRVMFPIWDIHDEVVGFTGRVLRETENSGGKYVNTPQTSVYDKSRVVFGLNKAKKAIKAEDLIVMVEGQMDVIACHQADMKNAVATSGTSLTEEAVKLLKRYSSRVNIAFDADAAGQAAAERGIDIARGAGMSVRIIKIPEGAGKDPDECVKKKPEVWRRAVVEAKDIMDWYLDKAFAGRNLQNPRELQAAVNEVLAKVAVIPYAVERDHWLKVLSSRAGQEVSVLRENMLEVKKSIKSSRQPPGASTQTAGQDKVGPAGLADLARFRNQFNSLSILLLKFPALAASVVERLSADTRLENTLLALDKHGELYMEIKKQYNETGQVNPLNLRVSNEESAEENIVDVLLLKGDVDFFGINEKEAREEAERLIAGIGEQWQRMRRSELQRRLREAEAAGDSATATALLVEFDTH